MQRNFIDTLWEETQILDEHEWKSSARKKIMNFEEQLHEAVEAGVSTNSGQKIWSLSNAFVYCFTLATTIGYGHLTPSSPMVRMVSIVYGGLAAPLLALLIGQISSFLGTLLAVMATRQGTEEQQELSSTSLLTILISYALFGSALFSIVFTWDIFDSIYFVFSTVSTVGFGDIVPEVGLFYTYILLCHLSQDSLVFLMFGGYILIGLAMYSLWIESVVVGVTIPPPPKKKNKSDIFYYKSCQVNIETQLSEMISRLENQKREVEKQEKKKEQ